MTKQINQKLPPYKAPDFSLVNSDGKRVGSDDYRGEWLVLYFYPADDTPGCTAEACSMRDSSEDFAGLGVSVIGISPDNPDSHMRFKQKYNLNFELLSDPGLDTIRAYGAWGKKMFGREGVLRKTFLIDADGVVRKVYGRVTPLGHGEQIVAELKRLQG